MIDTRRSHCGPAASAGRGLAHSVRALAFGFVALASRLLAPLVYAVRWRRRTRAKALAPLDTPIVMAAMTEDRIEEAGALAEQGLHALRRKLFALAEARFRAALALLSADDLPYLQASLRHYLALALHAQRKDNEAEHHAAAALAFHRDPRSRLAIDGRSLLADIRARRAAQGGDTSTVTRHDHQTVEDP